MNVNLNDKQIRATEKRLKSIKTSISIFEHALGIMEADGWFGGSPQVKGIGTTTAVITEDSVGGYPGFQYNVEVCSNGGPQCAGLAIHLAATERATLKGWNVSKRESLANRHLHLFGQLNGIGTDSWSTLCGIARWNDSTGKTYDDVKAAFGKAIRTLAVEQLQLQTKLNSNNAIVKVDVEV